MEFLKAILGEDLYAQVAEKINAHNGNEANKDKQVKIGNLGGGEYVGKHKYDDLQALLDGKTTELDTANGLIADLKKANKGNEDLQSKIADYETQIGQLQEQLKQTQLDSAIQVALLEAKAIDVPYMTFKLREKGEVVLDENGKIKGWDDKIAALKTQFPTQFETASDGGDGYQVLDPNRLEKGDGGETTPTKDEFRAMTYEQRVALKQKNEELYKKYRN